MRAHIRVCHREEEPVFTQSSCVNSRRGTLDRKALTEMMQVLKRRLTRHRSSSYLAKRTLLIHTFSVLVRAQASEAPRNVCRCVYRCLRRDQLWPFPVGSEFTGISRALGNFGVYVFLALGCIRSATPAATVSEIHLAQI